MPLLAAIPVPSPGRIRDAGLHWTYLTNRTNGRVAEVLYITDPAARAELAEINPLFGEVNQTRMGPDRFWPLGERDAARISERLTALLGAYPAVIPPGDTYTIADYLDVMLDGTLEHDGAEVDDVIRWSGGVSRRVHDLVGYEPDGRTGGTPLIQE